MIAANQLYNIAKPDGLTLAMISTGLYFDQLLGAKEVQFDWAKFGWIGSARQFRSFDYACRHALPERRRYSKLPATRQPPARARRATIS